MKFNEWLFEIENNKFDFELRSNLFFDDEEYYNLLKLLKDLECKMKNVESIPKAVALNLYIIPYVIRNTLDYLNTNQSESQLTQKVEDAWIEVDILIQSCLTDD